MGLELRNWAGNHVYLAARVHRPGSVDELRELVAGARKVRPLGTRHAFSDLGDTDGDLILLDGLNQVIELDPEAGSVTVQPGVRYGELGAFLREHGLALPNMASLPHISVAGACATATHGSGDGNGALSTSVRSLEIVRPDGGIARISRDADPFRFPGSVVALGALGVVAGLTLDVVPAFEVRQEVFRGLEFATLRRDFDAITSSAYSVSLFTTWRGPVFEQVWLKSRVGDAKGAHSGESFFGATPATEPCHPIADAPARFCTPQMGVVGAWDERLPHFRMEFTPSRGEELQSEYVLPRARAVEALDAVAGLAPEIAPHLFVSEVRTIAADGLWLSPFYERDAVAIHFTWKPDAVSVGRLLPRIEAALDPFEPRPHWAKLFATPGPILAKRYPRIDDFRRLATELDPEGKFRNGFVDRHLFSSEVGGSGQQS